MSNTVFNAHKPARELPISRITSKLLEEVDKQLKNLTTDVRHTYGREFIMLLLEMRRLIRKANAAIRTWRNWIGYEMNTEFFTKEELRIKETLATPTIF